MYQLKFRFLMSIAQNVKKRLFIFIIIYHYFLFILCSFIFIHHSLFCLFFLLKDCSNNFMFLFVTFPCYSYNIPAFELPFFWILAILWMLFFVAFYNKYFYYLFLQWDTKKQKKFHIFYCPLFLSIHNFWLNLWFLFY